MRHRRIIPFSLTVLVILLATLAFTTLSALDQADLSTPSPAVPLQPVALSLALSEEGTVTETGDAAKAMTQKQKIATTRGRLGYSIAFSGNTLAIGAPLEDKGAVYVFTRSGTNDFVQQAKLTAADGAVGDWFGKSIALEGDTLVISAPNADNGTLQEIGKVYVFARTGTMWQEQARLDAPTLLPARSFFGHQVAINGSTIAVGAYAAESTNTAANQVVLFVKQGTTWVSQATVALPDVFRFGSEVALDGDTLLVGACTANNPSVYVFARNGTAWNPQTS